MKRSMFAALLFPLVIAGCAADASSTEDPDDQASLAVPAAAPAPAVDEHVDTQAYSLMTSTTTSGSSTYCLPGETVKCTLGPPPVCTCVPATTTKLYYAW